MKIKMCDEFYYRIKEDENIFKKFNTSKENVLRNNKKLDFYTGEVIKIKLNNYINHIVSPMETISSICEKYHINEEKLMKDNDLTAKKLFIGQILKIFN